MPELSKTARASMGKQTKEVHQETPEEAIRQLRLNREAGLHVGDMSRVDALLAAYDIVTEQLKAILDGMKSKTLNVVPAAIPAQEEDPEHMADFEHGGEQ
jgi:hypothetical protein